MPAQRPQKAERKDVRCGGKAARAYKENEMRVISGTARGTRLAALPGEEITRPTVDRVKEGMFSAVQFLLAGARVLDLFAGSGQLGIEALSRGAARCVFIDSSREACAVVRQNLKAAGLFEKASVAETAAEMYLAACRERFPAVPSGYRSRAAACCGGRDGPGRDGAGGNGARRAPARALRHADAEKTIQIRHSGAGALRGRRGVLSALQFTEKEGVRMRIAICPGSFDPVTKGHLNIIERSAKLFDAVTVLVMVNPNKTPSFTAQERADFLRRVTGHIPNVKVDVYTGLLAEYAHNVGACTIIKGLRAVTDFEFEFQQALTNKKLNPELETMFVITDPEYMYLSSSMVRQVASFGGDVTDFLPDGICKDIVERLTQGRAKE